MLILKLVISVFSQKTKRNIVKKWGNRISLSVLKNITEEVSLDRTAGFPLTSQERVGQTHTQRSHRETFMEFVTTPGAAK